MKTPRTGKILYRFLSPIRAAYWLSVAGVLAIGALLPFEPAQQRILFLITCLSCVQGIIWFYWFIPRYGMKSLASYVIMMSIQANITAAGYLLRPFSIQIDNLFVVLVVSVGFVARRRFTLYTAALAALCESLLILLFEGMSQGVIISIILKTGILFILGLISNTVSDLVLNQTRQTELRNQHLSMLLQTSNMAAQVDGLQPMLTQVAASIALNVPVTACRISVLDNLHERLITYGAYPVLPLSEQEVGIGAAYPINSLPYLAEVLNSGQPRILLGAEVSRLTQSSSEPAFFYYGARAIILVPLNTQGACVGILTLGETSTLDSQLFDDEKMHLLQTLANQIASAIHSSQALAEARRQARRLAVTNEIGKAISATIEMDTLLELIYQELKKAMPSDTYYVALYLEEQNAIDMHLLIDAGTRFEPQVVPMGQGLASYVITNHRPLLIRNLPKEHDTLPVKPIVLGVARESLSWLGAPLMAHDRPLGMLAVASYESNAFDDEDQSLLSSIAAQAALALDNARQHAKVKEQALRDSLTGAYNHGQLLYLLQEAVEHGRLSGKPVSLIMLDIDYFKQYNDSYGHVLGDQVLCQLVQAIQKHVKRTDIVGRWGGEEFAVGLPGADAEQALGVAQRISQSLAATLIYDKTGRRIPSPTTSQGIATFPLHAQTSTELVDQADEALYRAKNAGRDQIMLAGRDPV